MKSVLMAAAAAASALALVPALAHAQTAPTGAYANLGYAQFAGDDVDLPAVQGRLGYRFSDFLAVEGELGAGVKEDEVGPVDVKLKHQGGAYLVGLFPFSANTDVFARVGYGWTKVKAEAAGLSASDSEDSFNWGVGAQHHFDGVNGVRVDYTRQEFGGQVDGSADVWSIGYSRRF